MFLKTGGQIGLLAMSHGIKTFFYNENFGNLIGSFIVRTEILGVEWYFLLKVQI